METDMGFLCYKIMSFEFGKDGPGGKMKGWNLYRCIANLGKYHE